MIFCNQAEKQCWLNRKRQEMEAEGLSENEIEEQIDALSQTNWTQQEYADYYGGQQDDWQQTLIAAIYLNHAEIACVILFSFVNFC